MRRPDRGRLVCLRSRLGIALVLIFTVLAAAGCGISRQAPPSASPCPSTIAIQHAQTSGQGLRTTLQGARCLALFPVLVPRWIPTGSRLGTVYANLRPVLPGGKATRPMVMEVDLLYTSDKHHHGFFLMEHIGSALTTGKAATIAGRAALVSVEPPIKGREYPVVQVMVHGLGASYFVLGSVHTSTAEHIAASLFAR